MQADVRWKQRFESYSRAYLRLKAAVEDNPVDELNELELEGVVQRFEYTLELAWKTIKDYLEHSGLALQEATPKAVVRAAFSAGVVQDGGIWIDMILLRNLLSHTYDEKRFEQAVEDIASRHIQAFKELYEFLAQRS